MLFISYSCKYAARALGPSKDIGKASEEPTCTGALRRDPGSAAYRLLGDDCSQMISPFAYGEAKMLPLILQDMKVGLCSKSSSQLWSWMTFGRSLTLFMFLISPLYLIYKGGTLSDRCLCCPELQFCFESEIN